MTMGDNPIRALWQIVEAFVAILLVVIMLALTVKLLLWLFPSQ